MQTFQETKINLPIENTKSILSQKIVVDLLISIPKNPQPFFMIYKLLRNIALNCFHKKTFVVSFIFSRETMQSHLKLNFINIFNMK